MATLYRKPLRAKRPHSSAKARTMHRYAQATLGSGDVHAAVVLPAGEEEAPWIAMHCDDFYNDINLLFGMIADLCTASSCPVMSAGRKFEYLWADGVRVKTPIQVSARSYVDHLLDWMEVQFSDKRVFPDGPDKVHHPRFRSKVKTMFKRLFRVYAHIYHSHFREMVALGAEAHLNSSFKRFSAFVLEFRLVDSRELAPMRDLILKMLGPAALSRGSGRLAEQGRGGRHRTGASSSPPESASKESGPVTRRAGAPATADAFAVQRQEGEHGGGKGNGRGRCGDWGPQSGGGGELDGRGEQGRRGTEPFGAAACAGGRDRQPDAPEAPPPATASDSDHGTAPADVDLRVEEASGASAGARKEVDECGELPRRQCCAIV